MTCNSISGLLLGASHGRQKDYAPRVVGTSGSHQVLGRMMRREAAKVQIGRARVKYSVTDGAE